MESNESSSVPPPGVFGSDNAVSDFFRAAEARGAGDPAAAAAFFAAGFRARIAARIRRACSDPARRDFVAAVLSELARCPFRDRLAAEPAFADFRSWCEVPFPPPPDIVAGFARVLSREFGPPARPAPPKISLADFRASFSRRDRALQLLGDLLGAVRAFAATGIRHPLAALRLVRDLATASRSRLFDRDFYCWAHPEVASRRFAVPLLHYCTGGWRKGCGFSPACPPLPPDAIPPRKNPLLLHARLFPGRQPDAETLRRLWRELRPDLWSETVRGRLRAEATPKPPLAVVVPVYDHPELLPPLVASLLEHTPPDVLLLFVENGSDDARVRPALLRLAAEHPGRVRVECLDENLGFAGACNHGMRAAAGRDVILLNNDTVVGPRWSDSLRLAAYADPRIGTATAVSNNSGLASVPDRGKNEMPPGLSVATVARGWLHATETVFDLHTGHGFCLYLKRAMLDDVGELDAETFGKGYGEETDLCLRARDRGWKHRITTRAFVWHLNAVSFGGLYKSFKVHVARHALLARHPELDALEDENIPRWGAFCPMLRSVDESIRRAPPRPGVLLLATAGKGDPLSKPFASALRRSFDILALERMTDGSAALRGTPDGMALETGAGTDDDLVSWTLEHGVEIVLAADPALAGSALRARFAALHVPVLDGLGPTVPGESPERAAARLGARLAAALSHAPQAPVAAPFLLPKTRDLVLPAAAVPGAFDPGAFDRTDLSDVRELVVDHFPLPVSDDARLFLLARLCGARLVVRAKTEDPHFWADRATPHFRLLAAADAVEKPSRPPLDAECLPFFPKPPPPPPPDVLKERVAGYLRAKAARTTPARHVVYTAIAGGYEALKIPDSPDPDVDYVYFAPAPAAEEGPWTYRPFAWTDEDPTRTARWHKLHGPELFPDAETVVWIDGNITPLPGCERAIRDRLLSGGRPIATLRHFDRANVFEEVDACIARGKDDPALLRAQVARYRAAGLPEGHPFAETTLLAFRPSDPIVRAVFATWWEELSIGSRRDQISFPFAMWKHVADFTPLFDRDVRLAVDKVRFGIHTRAGAPPPQPHVRQFVLSRRRFERHGFRHLELPDGFVLSFHPDLRVRATPDRRTVLLGLAWSCDPAVPDPLAAAATCGTEDALERVLDAWCGRWILLRDGKLRMDACGLLGVFFRDGECSSTPILPGRSPDVRRLLPGQGLDLSSGVPFGRPTAPAAPAFAAEEARVAAVLAVTDVLLSRIAADYPDRIRLPLTAGHAPRTLAALLEHAGVDCETFTMDRPGLSPRDREIPPRLAALMGLRHRRIPREGKPDPARLRTWDEHCPGLVAEEERDFYAFRQNPEPFETSCRVAVLRGGAGSPDVGRALDLVPGVDSIPVRNCGRLLALLRESPRDDRVSRRLQVDIVRAVRPELLDLPFRDDGTLSAVPDPSSSAMPNRPPDNAYPPPPTVQRLSGRAFAAFPRPEAGTPLVFSHSGKIGDVVYSLPFCRAVAAAAGRGRFAFHLKTGTVVERTRANGSIARTPLLDAAGAALLAPLLGRQPFVESVSVSDAVPAGALDLDLFRLQTCLPLWGNSLSYYYLPLAPWLADPPDLSRPWLSDGRRLDLGKKRIALFLTSRYPRETLSLSFLEPFREELLFLGTETEHAAFESAWFPVERRKIADFADALDVLSSVRFAIGNQTGFFAIAEALKIPRLLLVSGESPNVVPCGGAFQLLYETHGAESAFAAFRERFCG